MNLRTVFLCLLSSWFVLPAPASADEPRADRHALLIGVTYYENLPKSKHLVGPANDVLAVRKLLVDKLRFRPEQITVLSEQEGIERGQGHLPTRANIELAFKNLAARVKPGDQVMIHMGGHGSQQPEDRNSPDPEPDGLDELFLPRDVGAWNGAKRTLTNAIIDNDMSAWLKAIRDKKASVWITFDSCHSGTMIRGGNDTERTRNLDPVRDLGIPAQALKEAVDFAASRQAKLPERARNHEAPAPFKLAKEGGIVAIYACQPSEVTVERELPLKSKEGKVYGLLTYTMCQILTEAAERSKEPITYNELARRIQAQYIQWGRSAPTPLIEGIDRDRQVLGDKAWPGRSSVLLEADEDKFKINAGALHGLTLDSILAVMPPPGRGTNVVGHVRVKALSTYKAEVVPCALGKFPLVKDLPDGGACRLAFLDVGDQQIRVGIDARDANDKAVPSATLTQLHGIVKGLSGPQAMLRPADRLAEADWLLRVRGSDVMLVPGDGWSVGRAPLGNARFGPVAIDAGLGAWLKESLGTIARAENLKRLAAGGALAPEKNLGLELNIARKKSRLDSVPLVWPAPDVNACDGDDLLKVANKGQAAFDLTMLYIDSSFGIDCLYPDNGELNRLRPGDSDTVRIKVNSRTVGLENLVIIVVKADGQPVDFSQLAQPTLARALEKSGKRADDLKKALDSPLGKLLQRGMYGEGTARGTAVQDLNDHALFLVPFNVRPQKRLE